MRKKLAMRKGGKVSKYADGGLVRRPSLITNNPVGSNRARGLRPVGTPDTEEMDLPARPPVAMPEPVSAEQYGPPEPYGPPAPPARARTRTAATRMRSRRTTADDLNEREMTRLLNERSYEAAAAGRNMYRKGGRVKAKK